MFSREFVQGYVSLKPATHFGVNTMPRITTYGVSTDIIKKISRELISELAEITNTPRDHFNIRVNLDAFVFDGEEATPDAFVEVCLFNRSEAIEDSIAATITKHFHAGGIASVDVYLTQLNRRKYFENGSHF